MVLSSLEVRRQSFHIIAGTVIAVLFYFGYVTRIHLALITVILAVAFYLYRWFNVPIVHQMLTLMEREKNMKHFAGVGALLFVVGLAIAPWLFDRNIATAAMLILAWGDGVASLVGPYGRVAYFNKKKMWEGIIAAIIFGGVAASFVVPFWHAFAAATVAMLIEGLDITINGWKIDDNPMIPVVAGFVLTLFQLYF